VVPSGGAEVLAYLATTQSGLHAVSFESLFPGRTRPLSSELLRLRRQGVDVPLHLEPPGAQFGPGSVLYFHAGTVASSTSYSGEVVYALERAAGGARMGEVSSPPAGDPVGSLGRGEWETNKFYMPEVLDAADLWVWDFVVGGAAKTKSFSLEGVDFEAPASARLEVYLQGGSDSTGTVDHHVQISLNKMVLGEARFDGWKPHLFEADVPLIQLRDLVQGGQLNELEVKNLGDTGVYSRVLLDRIALVYPQRSQARSGRFEGVWAQGGIARLDGIDSSPVMVAVRPDGVDWVRGFEWAPSSLRFTAQPGVRYCAASSQGLLSPRVFSPTRSALRSTQNQADYILIAPQAFLPAAEPLLQRRQDQGLTTLAVSLEEISSAFGHGQPSAEAIRDFLAFAFHSWRRPSPRYVLLLGDSSFDPRRFNPKSSPAPLPALWSRTSYLWTVSDPSLAAVNGEDSLPDLAIGRLPATTLDQAHSLVNKILDWEDASLSLDGAATLVADNSDPKAGDFEADVRDIAHSFLEARNPQLLLLGELGLSETKARLFDSLDQGLSLLSYVGHGGHAIWADESILTSWDIPSLRAQSRQPLVLTMNCLNGYFVASTFDSLAEAFLKAEGRGSIASFSPSGLSLDGPAHVYHRALMAEITSAQHARLGDAILAAQKTYAASGQLPELLNIYQLLGDPALKVR
jgi:hypothetical protein